MLYSNVRLPVWSNPDRTAIDCFVTFAGVGEVPFTANPNDVAEHGRVIYADCVSGLYGPIQEYVAPVVELPTRSASETESQPTVQGAQTL